MPQGQSPDMRQPYLVNRRPMPMNVGGIPVVIPSTGCGASIVAMVPTQTPPSGAPFKGVVTTHPQEIFQYYKNAYPPLQYQ